MQERERGGFEGAGWRSRLALALAVAVLSCGAWACAGPGLEPPGSTGSSVGPMAAGTGGTSGLVGGADAGNTQGTGSATGPMSSGGGAAGNRGGTGGSGFMNTQKDGGVPVSDGGSGEDAGATR